jgi:hypothetical protein
MFSGAFVPVEEGPPARRRARLLTHTGRMAEERHAGAVLLVEADVVERELIASALDADGFEVLTCPGPTEPDYTCVGGRTGTCPLVDEAAVVVLDMRLDSEAVMTGTPAEELLGLYLTSGRPVVALGSRPHPGIERQLIRVPRHADAAAVAAAVGELHPATRPSSADPSAPI